MSVLAVEGFEGASPELIRAVGISGIGAVIDFTTLAGPWSKAALKVNDLGGGRKVFPGGAAAEIYLAVRVEVPSTAHELFKLRHPDATQSLGVRITSLGKIELRNAADSVVGTGATTLAVAYHLIEVHATVGASTLVEVWLDGLAATELSVSGVDTQSGSQTTIEAFDTSDDLRYDDLIVYSVAGSRNNARIGDKVVLGLFPVAKGDAEQWNPAVASAQRWYFPRWSTPTNTVPTDGYLDNDNGAGYRSPVTVTPAALWDVLSSVNAVSFAKGVLSPHRSGTAIGSDISHNGGFSAAQDQDALMGQFISPPIAAQTVSGTVKMQMQVSEASAARDARSQLVVRVVSHDGLTVRGTLYAGDTGSLTDEWAVGTETNQTFPQDPLSPATMTSVVASEGDRIVVEYGFRQHQTGTNANDARMNLGDGGSSGDLADSESDTQTGTTFNPWIEFSNAISLSDDGNWEHVEEWPPDDGATYVETATTSDRDLYQFQNVGAEYTVDGPIVLKTRMKKVDPGSRTAAHVYKTSGAEQTSGTKGLQTTEEYQETVLDEDGTDAAAWSNTKVNSIQFGPKAT